LLFIIAVAILIRIYFSIGHIFSDDAYYSYLSYTLLNGNFTDDYLGYPIFPLRITFLSILAVSYAVFGVNEIATVAFPFLLSIANLFLTYKLAKILTKNENIALLSVLLISFFPTDVAFSTISFVDLPNAFFINLGIYFLYKSYRSGKNRLALVGGICFLLSMQIKENIYYTAILLIILWIYLIAAKKTFNIRIPIALSLILINVVIEGAAYLFLHNDFLYRLTVLQQNYIYSYYDFFPYTSQKLSGVKSYWRNIFDQIFLINCRAIFFRRFYLFLPFFATIKCILNIKKKENVILTYWFLGTLILLITFTTSFTEYKPLDLKRSWYIYPLLMPTVILMATFIYNNFKIYIRYALVSIYIIGGIIMCGHYENFFDKDNITELKAFLSDHTDNKIYTDHFTKYSVDLIRNYSNLENSERILGKDFNLARIIPGCWVLYNQKHIDELKLQKYQFPDFSILKSKMYNEAKSYGDFIIYEKVQ
jgi:4-amino-4-deoxy-L-arabinose transferase-like glycosyltransferase